MAPTGTTLDRSLFDPKQPYGIVFYPWYSPREVGNILNLGDDKVRQMFGAGAYGKVLPIRSQRHRPKRKNYVTLRIPYETLISFLEGNELSA